MSTNGTASIDFTDAGSTGAPLGGGTYFGAGNLQFYTNPASPSGVFVSSIDPYVATVEPVWTFINSSPI